MACTILTAEVKAPAYDVVELASPGYEARIESDGAERVLDLLGSRSTQAVLADAVLTVVLSLYFSLHRLLALSSARQLSLACAHLARAGADPSPSLARSCARAGATLADHAAAASPQAVRWGFLLLIAAKAIVASWYLGLGRRDSGSTGTRACDFVVTTIALHALAGFSSFLFLPALPSTHALLAAAQAHPLATTLVSGTLLGTTALALAKSTALRRSRQQGSVVLV